MIGTMPVNIKEVKETYPDKWILIGDLRNGLGYVVSCEETKAAVENLKTVYENDDQKPYDSYEIVPGVNVVEYEAIEPSDEDAGLHVSESLEKVEEFEAQTSFGSLSGLTTIEQLTNYAKTEWKVPKVELEGLDPVAVRETFIEMDKVISDFPCILKILKGIESSIITERQGFMGYTASDDMFSMTLRFSILYKDKSALELLYNKQEINRNVPKGTNYAHA